MTSFTIIKWSTIAIGWLASAVVVFGLVLPFLISHDSDLGVVLGFSVGIVYVLGFAVFINWLIKHIRKKWLW